MKVPGQLLPLVLLFGCAGPAPDAGPDGAPVVDVDAAARALLDADATPSTRADGDAPEDAATDPYPLDDALRVNHIQCKGTHNSTHIAPEFTVPEWEYSHRPLYEQLDVHGVRQVELDVHYNGDGTFDVYHLPRIDQETTCQTFLGCLGELKAWSDDNPQHHLLFVLVEPKDEMDFGHEIAGHYDELDQAILSVWPPERILLPDDVRGTHPTLRGAIESDGWPTLGETRQMAMFVMLDSEAHRTNYLYAHPELAGAVLFARDGIGESWGAVVESASAEEKIAAAQNGYLIRGRGDSATRDAAANAAKAEAALASSAHFISCDFVYAVDEGFWFDVPGGAPSRCNPVTAPPSCRSADIE